MGNITILSQPGGSKKWVLSKNPFIISAKTTDYVNTEGRHWKRAHTVSAEPVAGDTWSIDSTSITALNGGPVAYSFVTSVSNQLTQIKAWDAEQYSSIEEWIDEEVLPALLMHPVLNTLYTFYRQASNLFIESLGYSSDDSVSSVETGTFTLVKGTIQTASTPDINSAVKIGLRLHVNTGYNAGVYDVSPWYYLDLVADEDAGTMRVDISEQLDAMIQGHDFPPLGIPNSVQKAARKVFVEVASVDTATGEVLAVKKTNLLNVLKGGYRINDLDTQYGEFVIAANWGSGGGFITNREQTVFTTIHAKDYLHFHTWPTDYPGAEGQYSEMRIKARVYYVDGTEIDDDIYTINITDGYQATQILSVPSGFLQLGLDAWYAQRAYKYEIYCGSMEWPAVTFRLIDPTDTGFSLVYLNDYGLPESIWCEGERAVTATHSREITEMQRGIQTDWAQRMTEISSERSLQLGFEVTSAPLSSKEWYGHLGSLLSKQLWIWKQGLEIDPIPVQLVPGTMSNETVNWQGNSALVMKFKLRMAKESGWSNLLNNML